MPAGAPITPAGARRVHLQTKRHQVSKACDSCRAHRIKCDNNRPCLNCQAKNRVCTQASPTQAATSTLSAAHKEIDDLRQKVLSLEQELQHRKNAQIDPRPPTPSPLFSTHPTPPSQSVTPRGFDENNHSDEFQEYHHGSLAKVSVWEGTFLRPPRSPHASWFGPSSLYDFVRRFSIGLSTRLQKYQHNNDPAGGLLPEPAGSAAFLNTIPEAKPSSPSPSTPPPASAPLTSIEEEYFISLFWESYHTCVFPIIDEAEFKEHRYNLWADGEERKPSALADMVLAFCMQIGVSAMPTARQGAIVGPNQDATVAGCFYYRRAQRLLAQELDSPTYATLQCYLVAAVYQCGGSFHNMVDGSVAQALRVAYMLGLHIDPSSSLSGSFLFDEKECQRRRILWSAVYLLDSKVGMKFGRPFLIRDHHDYGVQQNDTNDSDSNNNNTITNTHNTNRNNENGGGRGGGGGGLMPRLPGHDLAAARLSVSSSFGLLGSAGGNDITWLSFHVWHTRLYIALKRVHCALYEADVSRLLLRRLPGQQGGGGGGGGSISNSPGLLNAIADMLLLRGGDWDGTTWTSSSPSSSAVQLLQSWAESVPAGLSTPRLQDGDGDGKPFSTQDGSFKALLQLETFEPVWVKRQRLLLEAAWHHQMASMFRVFITFDDRNRCGEPPPTEFPLAAAPSYPGGGGGGDGSSSSSAKDHLASVSVSHAVAFTHLTQQVLAKSSLLDGWHEMFQWQWSSAMILAGYLLSTSCTNKGKWAVEAREALPLAVNALQGFGARFGIARDAARIVTGLIKQIDELMAAANEEEVSGGAGQKEREGPEGMMAVDGGMMQGLEGEFMDLEGLFTGSDHQDFLDLALGVDFWGEADALWPDMEHFGNNQVF